jgi:hypothetical protein
MSTALAAKDQAREAFANVLAVGKRYAAELIESDDFFKPVVMAMAIKDIKDSMTPEAMSAIKELAGTSLGFLTDKKPDQQYPIEVIRDCVLEAMLRGVGVTNNQFNIIAGRFYMARNGWEAKLRKAGCSQIVPTVGRPEDVREGKANSNGFAKYTAVFGAQATCVKGGQRYCESATIKDGVDGRIEASAFGRDLSECIAGMKGKVEARILKKLYCLACDAIESDDEGELSHVIVVEPDQQPEKIEQQPEPTLEPEITDRERALLAFQSNHRANQKMIKDDDQRAKYNEYWETIFGGKNKDELRLLYQDLGKQVKSLGAKNVAELQRWCEFCAEVANG